jgi:hypothetical protein
MDTIHLTWWVGMDVVIRMLSAFMILNPSPDVFINRLRCIRLSKPIILLSVHLSPGCMIIIRRPVPAPYNHSNIDSDELLYYVDGDFMSRKNVTRGMITLHPAGIPHGPHPGAVEKSIGKKETGELAVMVDTFHPLMLTRQADPDRK